jgi:nucleoid-associated protein YgaU
MGLFNFIKSVGNKLRGHSDAQPVAADALTQEVQQAGLAAPGLAVKVDGDKVTVTGNARSQEEAEKIILALGNTTGVAAVQSELTVNNVAHEEPKFYTVQKGDTLWKIAETHYGAGKGAKYTEIVKANTPPVKNPDLIQPGWVLRIPPLA